MFTNCTVCGPGDQSKIAVFIPIYRESPELLGSDCVAGARTGLMCVCVWSPYSGISRVCRPAVDVSCICDMAARMDGGGRLPSMHFAWHRRIDFGCRLAAGRRYYRLSCRHQMRRTARSSVSSWSCHLSSCSVPQRNWADRYDSPLCQLCGHCGHEDPPNAHQFGIVVYRSALTSRKFAWPRYSGVKCVRLIGSRNIFFLILQFNAVLNEQ